MSVELATLKDDDWPTVELWAPDYDGDQVWLVYADDVGHPDRIDLTRPQLVQLSAAIDRLLS
jgi:hypothetical protein